MSGTVINVVTLSLDEFKSMLKQAGMAAVAEFVKSQPDPGSQRIYTREEAAGYLRLFKKDGKTPNPNAIDRLRRGKLLGSIGSGNQVRITKKHLDEYERRFQE